jgi:hypothetical protein
MRVLYPIKPLSDYNISGPLNSALKSIQEMDTVSGLGKRNIGLSKNPRLPEGFQLNRRNLSKSVLSCATSTIVLLQHVLKEHLFIKINR